MGASVKFLLSRTDNDTFDKEWAGYMGTFLVEDMTVTPVLYWIPQLVLTQIYKKKALQEILDGFINKTIRRIMVTIVGFNNISFRRRHPQTKKCLS